MRIPLTGIKVKWYVVFLHKMKQLHVAIQNNTWCMKVIDCRTLCSLYEQYT